MSTSVGFKRAATYWIRVAGWQGNRGLFTLTVDSTAVPSAGDICADALPILIPGTGSSHTLASNSGCEVLCIGRRDECATTCTGGSNFDTTLQVYSGACGSLTPIACNDDASGSCGLLSRVTWVADAGVTYRFRIAVFAGLFSQAGNYDLGLNYSTCPADI